MPRVRPVWISRRNIGSLAAHWNQQRHCRGISLGERTRTDKWHRIVVVHLELVRGVAAVLVVPAAAAVKAAVIVADAVVAARAAGAAKAAVTRRSESCRSAGVPAW